MLSLIFPDQKPPDTFTQFGDQVELICIDRSQAATRAERLNLGVARSKGEMVFLHHPRSRVDPSGIEYLVAHSQEKIWGGFSQSFDTRHPLLKLTSWYTNNIRPRFSRVVYLDHGIFFHRSFFQHPIAPIPIMEDTVLCHQLRRHGRPVILPFQSVTSAIRYETNGVWRQAGLNQLMKLGFFVGIPPERLNRWYERGLHLNG
ncbi:MAG: hypothetical protein AB7F86_07875 [Bdellovibrionales bacterium]